MKNKTTQRLGNKNLLSFSTHDSLKYWRLKSNRSYVITISEVNQSRLQESTCADNMKL
jgi:hypothetical protein